MTRRMNGLDAYGAAEIGTAAFADQTITIRLLDVDAAKLKEAIGGTGGALASIALGLVNYAPKAALDAARPIVTSEAKNYGITMDMSISNKPAPEKRALSEFWPGLLVGGALGGGALLIWKLIGRLLGR